MAGRPRVVHVQKVAGISGSERHLLDLVPHLREEGWDARFVVLHDDARAAATFTEALADAEVPVDQVRLRAHADPIAVAELARLFRRLRPQIVHTHLVHADFHGLAAGALAGVPVRMSTKHGFDDFRHRAWFALADRTVSRLAHRQVAVSEGLARYLVEVERFPADAFDVVHYGITPADEPPALPADGPVVCVGRLIPIKGHRVLLQAFSQVRERLPRLRLDIVGEGSQAHTLREYANEIGLDGSVRFSGSVWPVEPAMEQASVVVVPSLGEGFGRVALEAMERGRPVVASRVGGLAEVVEDGVTGVLVPPGEPEPLAAALLRLAENPELAREMGDAGRRRAIELFSHSKCAERTAALYRDALGR